VVIYDSSTSSSGQRYPLDDDGEDKDSSKPKSMVLVLSSPHISGPEASVRQ